MTVTAVADGVYTIQFDHVRVFVIEDRPTGMTTLVDAAFPDDGHESASALESEFGNVDWLVTIHGDEGHFGKTPTVLSAFDPELPVLGGAKGFYDAPDIEAGRHFRRDDVLDGGIRIVQVPGHTVANDDLLLENGGVFIAGDVVKGSDCHDLPPGFLVPSVAQFNDLSHEEAEWDLVELFDYDIETMLAGHGTHIDDDLPRKLDDWLIDHQWTLSYWVASSRPEAHPTDTAAESLRTRVRTIITKFHWCSKNWQIWARGIGSIGGGKRRELDT